MIAAVLRALALAARMHAAWPAQPLDRVGAAAIAAVLAERPAVPAELLAAIAEHESDLRSNAVSYRSGAQRVDILWVTANNSRYPAGAVCGYLAATLDRAGCLAAIAGDGGMTFGAEQIEAWMRACRGDQRCGLAGYAGGWAGARAARSGEVTVATRFADLFLDRARRLSSPHLRARAHWTWSARLVSIGGHTWG